MTKPTLTDPTIADTTAPPLPLEPCLPALSDLSLRLGANLELDPRTEGVARHVERFSVAVVRRSFEEGNAPYREEVVGGLALSTFAVLNAALAGVSLVLETDIEGGTEFDFAQHFLADAEPAPHVAAYFEQPLRNVVLVHKVDLDDDLVDALGESLAPLLVAEVLQRAFPNHDAYFLAPPDQLDDPDAHRRHRDRYAAIGAFVLDDGYLGIDPANGWLGHGRSRLRQGLEA